MSLVTVLRNSAGEQWEFSFKLEYRDGSPVSVPDCQKIEFRVATLGRNGAEVRLVGFADMGRGVTALGGDDASLGEGKVPLTQQFEPNPLGEELQYELWIQDPDGVPMQLEIGRFELRPSLKAQLDLPA